MARFESPDRSAYSPAQREFYDRYATGPRADPAQPFRLIDDTGTLIGPPSLWVLSPDIGLALAGIGFQMRWGLAISDRAREAVILAVADAHDSAFERFAHEPAARAAGWGDDDLAALRAREVPGDADDEVRAALEVTWRLLDAGALDGGEYARAEEYLGTEKLFHVVTLVGYYRMVATQLAVFDIRPPDAGEGPTP